MFFPGQVGQGKVQWKDLPQEDLWNGVGCGGSQKSEIAYLDQQPNCHYSEIDAIHFLRGEFPWGKEVVAWDDRDEIWKRGKIKNPPQAPKSPKKKSKSEQTPQFLVECSKSGNIFATHQVRHGDKMQNFLKAVGEYPFLKMVDKMLKENAEVVGSRPRECMLPDGEVSGPGFGKYLNIVLSDPLSNMFLTSFVWDI